MAICDSVAFGLDVWHQMLDDTAALLHSPVAHHRELVHLAYELRDAHVVDNATLVDMLELSDSALLYARDAAPDIALVDAS